MKVTQFVMAYKIEQDRIRAMLPEGFESLRPVLRINTEIRGVANQQEIYIEFNTPAAFADKNGWLNIANWSSNNIPICCTVDENKTEIKTDFFSLTYTLVGIQGGCPAEKSNDGCYYPDREPHFIPTESISANKEFCDCVFSWHFHEGDAHGQSIRKNLPAFAEDVHTIYEKRKLTAENAAAIPCEQVLGTYVVTFER